MNTSLVNVLTLLFLFLIFQGCSPTSESIKMESRGIVRAIVSELQQIHTREDLLKSSPKLRKQLNRLVESMIKARTLQLQSQLNEAQFERQPLCDVLRNELNRVYKLDGGREIIENCQKDALDRLDQFEQKILKGKLSRN